MGIVRVQLRFRDLDCVWQVQEALALVLPEATWCQEVLLLICTNVLKVNSLLAHRSLYQWAYVSSSEVPFEVQGFSTKIVQLATRLALCALHMVEEVVEPVGDQASFQPTGSHVRLRVPIPS